MTDSITVQVPERLDSLAIQIIDDIDRRARGKEEWLEATIALCEHLAEAKSLCQSSAVFGRWLADTGFDLSKDERAAAIAMGKDIERARLVLAATDRRSLTTIHKYEFQVRNVTNSENPKSGKRKKPTVELEAALNAYDRRALAGEPITIDAVAGEAGVSQTPARRAITIRQTEKLKETQTQVTLSSSAQAKLDAAIRAHMRTLDLQFETRVRQETNRILDELSIPHYLALLKRIDTTLSSPRLGVMTKAEYKKIMSCLHPDGINSRTKEQLEEAFRIFTHYKIKMVADEDVRKSAISSLPRTVEELLARKRKQA